MADSPCCPVGARDDAAELGAALLAARAAQPGAETLNAIHRRTGIRKQTLMHHRDVCLGARTATEPGARTTTNRAEPTGEPAPLLDEVRILMRRARRLLKRVEGGEKGVDFKAAASFVRELRATLELQAKLLGELKAANTTVNVFASPDWARLRDAVLDELAAHPAALDAVIARLATEQGGATLH